ncbi:MAG: ATP-binding protein [Candidatus Ratteibacteria bacterium]|nr:ATP-binding protein [Candidatus Ratteibacteria bacterium]
MGARTIFDRIGNRRSGLGHAYTPFARRLVPPKIRRISSSVTTDKPYLVPHRSILIGEQLHPDTGEAMSNAYIPLPSTPGMNEAINVYGSSGCGKSVLIRKIVEYFSIEEHRAVIIIDPTKNQYWSFNQRLDVEAEKRKDMLASLRRFGQEPTAIPDVEVYVPIYDEAKLTWPIMQRDFHATKLLSIRTSGMTPSSFFELGDKEPAGRDFQRYLELILTRPKSEKTISYIREQLSDLGNQKSTSKSADSLKNLFNPLCDMGIIRDDGTDVAEMLHPPRTNKPGKISVISLGTTPTDRRRDALLSTILQQLFECVRDDNKLRPVFVIDETKQFAPADKSEHKSTRDALVNFNVLTRAWGVTRVHAFQYPNQIAEGLLGENVPINIAMTKSLPLSDGVTKINGTGLGRVHINGMGDPSIPDCSYYARFMSCRTRHVD